MSVRNACILSGALLEASLSVDGYYALRWILESVWSHELNDGKDQCALCNVLVLFTRRPLSRALLYVEFICFKFTITISPCRDLHAGLQCIQSYTRRCMSPEQRAHFNKLYAGTAEMIHQLCEDNQYQEGKYVFYINKPNAHPIKVQWAM